MTLEKVVADLIRKVDRRFYGKYRGFVVDNADPEKLGRLKVRVPSVLGAEVVTGWALPCTPYGGNMNQGFLFIPEVGAGVWTEFEEGDLEFPIWVGTFWSKPGGKSELPKLCKSDGSDESNVQDPPTGKIIKTLKGHTIQFEDKDGEEMVTIVEAENNNVITMNKDGICIRDGAGNEIKLDEQGINCKDSYNNVINLQSSGITVKSTQIKIGENATEPLVLGNQLKTALNNWINTVFATHIHTGNMGAPTTPPIPGAPLVLNTALSLTNKVE